MRAKIRRFSDVRWLKDKKYVIAVDGKAGYNKQRGPIEGREILQDDEFRRIAVTVITKTVRAKDELAILKGLKHENIVEFIDVDEIADRGIEPMLYFLTEMCDRNLKKYMKECKGMPMAIQKFMSISDQLLDGLEYIHGKNLIHGDITPDNIWVYDNDTFKYSGFGLTKKKEADITIVTKTRSGRGSNGYRPAEAYVSDAGLTQASDIFSLGIIFAQLISRGVHPYGLDPLNWLYHIRHNLKLDLSSVDIRIPRKKTQLIKLLTQMLSNKPDDRPALARIREHPFFRE